VAARSALLAAALALPCAGCFSVRYVAQATAGEYQILHEARSISKVVADPGAPERIRRLLGAVRTIKAYGQAHGLKPTRNYARYADLHRPAAVWVVQACAPLAFQVKRWRFPLVGTIPYLGFFDPAAARRFARSVADREELDVDVRTAGAFSTLGWFQDPVLSTMIPDGDGALGDLANVILHESVHATLYVNDQSSFNESLASFVADRLTRPWLEEVLGRDAPEVKAWVAGEARYRGRVARLHRAYDDLDAVYKSARSDAEKRAEKARILDATRRELGIRGTLNNATLSGYRTYDTGTEAFDRLLTACGGSFPRLLRAAATLQPADFGRPQQEALEPVIDRLAKRGCPGA
jgi:predicted aminopeptidase